MVTSHFVSRFLFLTLTISFSLQPVLTWGAVQTNTKPSHPTSSRLPRLHDQIRQDLVGAQQLTSPEQAPSAKEQLLAKAKLTQNYVGTSLIFDLPVTYNRRVSHWITYFQTNGKNWFRDWLEKSSLYMPIIQKELKNNGLPQDLAFMVMIESGFSANAISHANAVGPWQFIQGTAQRYGLSVHWWLDERRDLMKATRSAIRYLKDLYSEFGSWYLVAASYNMGEAGLRRQIKKRSSRDFWVLSASGALPQETMDYVPKILAAMLIAKSPGLYGFRDLAMHTAYDYDIVSVPGGTDLKELADHLGVTHKSLKDLNAELLLGYVPKQISKHFIRVPRGAASVVADFVAIGMTNRYTLNANDGRVVR